MIKFLNSLRHKKIGRKLLVGLIVIPMILTGFKYTTKLNNTNIPSKYHYYVVDKGDVVDNIAKKVNKQYKLCKDYRKVRYDIIKQNKIKNSMIYPNTALLVPVKY